MGLWGAVPCTAVVPFPAAADLASEGRSSVSRRNRPPPPPQGVHSGRELTNPRQEFCRGFRNHGLQAQLSKCAIRNAPEASVALKPKPAFVPGSGQSPRTWNRDFLRVSG